MSLKKKFFLSVVSVISIAVILILYVNFKVSNKGNSFNGRSNNIWAHRGLVDSGNGEPNSIESIKIAIDLNINGVELDVFYDVKLDDFIVSHDYPYNYKNGSILLLDSVFSKFNSISYWLDFKNLEKLSPKEVILSNNKLNFLIHKNKISKKKLLIESVSVSNLSFYAKGGYYTSWWVLPQKSKYLSILRNYNYKIKYIFNKYSSLSMPHKYYERIKTSTGDIPVNLFTVNDSLLIQKFIKDKKVQIILTDKTYSK